MSARPVIEAVIVNHDTSIFSELALRSLVASECGNDDRHELRITIRDNHSNDDGLQSLQNAAQEVGASFELSRWPAAEAEVNTHGDVLRDFVLDKPGPDYFLLVDADIDFEEASTVATMLEDLRAAEDLWAVQARFRTAEANAEGGSLDIWAGRDMRLKVGFENWNDVRPVDGLIRRRCHPGCTLITNTPTFRRAAEQGMFSTAVLLSGDKPAAGFFDTFGLASAAMAVAGYRYALSRATVHHYFGASYDKRDHAIAARDVDVRRRLARFAG